MWCSEVFEMNEMCKRKKALFEPIVFEYFVRVLKPRGIFFALQLQIKKLEQEMKQKYNTEI